MERETMGARARDSVAAAVAAAANSAGDDCSNRRVWFCWMSAAALSVEVTVPMGGGGGRAEGGLARSSIDGAS